jgi:two-component system, cell cycle response regulator DivK
VRPDAIIMDLSLPTMDGWQATRRLKGDEITKNIPVIVVTGHALAGVEKSARDAGADMFLTKPCLPEDLAATVVRVLDGKRQTA